MSKDKNLKLVGEGEFIDRLVAIFYAKIKKMHSDHSVVGQRMIIKTNMTATGKRYTVLIDAGEVYKFLVDPDI